MNTETQRERQSREIEAALDAEIVRLIEEELTPTEQEIAQRIRARMRIAQETLDR